MGKTKLGESMGLSDYLMVGPQLRCDWCHGTGELGPDYDKYICPKCATSRQTCIICKRLTPAKYGGLCSTGNILAPTYQWICNECLKDMVCP